MNEGMKINAAGRDIIKASETCELVAYKDVGSRNGLPITAGWGSTHRPDGTLFTLGETITQEEADAFFEYDLGVEERVIYKYVNVPLNTNQFSACGSFIYNIGEEQFAESTFLKLLNAGNFTGAANQFGVWINGQDGPLPGLVTRRAAEKALFMTPVTLVAAPTPVTIPDVVAPPAVPAGYVTNEIGNTTIVDVTQSQIVKKSDSIKNVAALATGATAMISAATPVVTVAAGMNWKLVAAFAVLGIAVVLAGALAWAVFKALGIKSDRIKMFLQGIA